jgi:hypothetical protein
VPRALPNDEGMLGIVVRAPGREPEFDPREWTRPGHLYRGMEEAEWSYIVKHKRIRSDERWSIPGEGTNFTDDARDAESYVNYGRTDPRKTGRPNYLVEVKHTSIFRQWRDGYWKTPEVPATLITRVWQMMPVGPRVVAYQIGGD